MDIAHLSLFAYLSIDKFILFFEKLSSNEARVSEMNSYTDMLTAVLQTLTSLPGIPTEHFYLFDRVAYFLLRFNNEI